MNRREFMVMGAAGAALAGMSVRGDGKVVKLDAPPRNRRPYAGLDWSKVIRVKTTSHGHAPTQWWVDQYLKRGFGLLTLSNY